MRRVAQLSAIAVLLVACSGTSNSTTTTEFAAPVTIPSGWMTHTDETSGYSLSYPSDWEVLLTVDEAALADLLGRIETGDIQADTASVMTFNAGLLDPNGDFNPNVNLLVLAVPDDLAAPDDSTVDKMVEAMLDGLKVQLPSYESSARIDTVVSGADSILLYGSYEMSEVDPTISGRLWIVQLYTYDGRAAWHVTCSSTADTSGLEPDLEVCETVLRTFELSSS